MATLHIPVVEVGMSASTVVLRCGCV